ncbi:MAG TPA: acetyltransferase [Verrucomicrobiae bacterium]|nr:acetyltransferase [Verrucomicrobiae bacterium]
MNSQETEQSHLILYGAGGHARVAIEAARAGGFSPSLVIDDQPKSDRLAGVLVQSAKSVDWQGLGNFRFIVAIGDNATRARLFEELKGRGGLPETIIHPFSWISPSALIGAGTVVFGGVVVNADARVGENCILNTSCSVDHDANIAAHVHLCPGVRLAGNVTIAERTMLGTGAVCIPGIKIGADAKIGAGSIVVRDVPDRAKVFGNPARVYGKTDA